MVARMAAAALLVAVVISVMVAFDGPAAWVQSIDDSVHGFFVTNEVSALVALGRFFGFVGSVPVMATVVVAIAAYLGSARRWNEFMVWVIAIAASQAVIVTMKSLYGRQRPSLSLMETVDLSFPSGHAVTGAVVAFGLVLVVVPPSKRRRVYWFVAVAYAVMMAWSRVYVRAHWLSDVTAGLAIGTAIVALAWLLIARIDASDGREANVDTARS